jgi:predicted nucleic acid-binding Zn ribbon protein
VLWQRHPSRISEDATLTGSMAKDPQTAFRHWARTMRSRGQSLPVCPACQCPTPVGELKRWSVCALCATKRFAAPPSPPAAP